MEHTPFFKKLSTKERAQALNPGVAALLAETLGVRFSARPPPPVVREALLANVAYAYQHYGFCVFAPSSQAFLASALQRETGVSFEDILGWLEETAYALLEDFTILKLLEGEPDWHAVDNAFFKALAKRAVCAEPGETCELGLDCWDVDLVSFLRVLASEALEALRAGTPQDEILALVSERLTGRPDAAVFGDALRAALVELHENPLRLLIWRVECFSSFCDIRQEAKFFVRNESSQVEKRAFELAGLLSLLHPHRNEDGVRLLEESPVTVAQLEMAVNGRSRSSRYFDCSLLREWMDLGSEGGLQPILDESRRLGLVFELTFEPKQTSRTSVRSGTLPRQTKKYGLTKAALGILRPFASSITEAILTTAS